MATSSMQTTAPQKNSNELERIFKDKLLTKIFRFYEDLSLIDVTFKVSNPASFVPAHRLILSAASPYFEDLFNGDRGNNPVIEINDIDSDIFESLITFCYTGQVLVTLENVAAMLKSAISLQLEDAATTCVDYLMAHINECTLQGAYALERETQYELLMQNFMEISQSEEFLNFEVEKLQCLLESDNLNIVREEDAFHAITRWFNHNVAGRREHLPLLISSLRLTQFDVNFLLTHIQALPGCENLALKAVIWIKEPAVRTKINIRFAGRRGELTLLALYKEVYDIVEPLITARHSAGAVTLNGKIYVLGGYSKNILNYLKSVECYNPDSNTWTSCAVMIKDHTCTVAAAHNGHIYVAGGSWNLYRTVERYDPLWDTWSEICCLNTDGSYCPRIAFASLDNKLWTMGGLVRSENKTNLSVYDEENDLWIEKNLLAKGSIYSCFVVPASLLPSN